MKSNRVNTLKEKAYNIEHRFIIAIDGPSASGKGTIAKMLAEKFTMKNFASSIFYRKLASLALRKGLDSMLVKDIIKLSENAEELNSYITDDLYNEAVTQFSSKIAAIPEVRLNLRKPQRLLIEQNRRLVLDGRDIGTVIAPDADLKLFFVASDEERAKRRFDQLRENGQDYDLNEIHKSIKERDARDQERETSPLKAATDAIIIDTTKLNAEETLAKIIAIIESK
ncbi:MAG: cmk [Rickettsiaceae bacterium]|jgi:cytidylate kinase|nr:cmk [Rickettsiaceae bacterium]